MLNIQREYTLIVHLLGAKSRYVQILVWPYLLMRCESTVILFILAGTKFGISAWHIYVKIVKVSELNQLVLSSKESKQQYGFSLALGNLE